MAGQEDHDMGAWEATLPQNFDHKKFHEDAEAGLGGLWLICTENQGDFKRYRGVLNNIDGWPTVSIDLGTDYAYINARHDQTLTREQIAIEVMKLLGATELFKDGVKVTL